MSEIVRRVTRSQSQNQADLISSSDSDVDIVSDSSSDSDGEIAPDSSSDSDGEIAPDSSSDSDGEEINVPPVRAVRGRPPATSTRGRRAQPSHPRGARSQVPAPVLVPDEPANPHPIVVAPQRPPPRGRRAATRGGRRPAGRTQGDNLNLQRVPENNPPSPPPAPPGQVEEVNAVPPDLRVPPPAPPVANRPQAVARSFECVVCMECLSAPATIMENQNPANAADNPVLGIPAVNLPADIPNQNGRRRSFANLAQINPRDIMTTPCGHMYHLYCIQRWFAEKGRKTCPSCRKLVPGKLIKLYPTINENPEATVQAEAIPAVSVSEGSNNNPDAGQGARNRAQEMNAVGLCENPACEDMRLLHRLLQTDNQDLQQQLNEANEARAGMTENMEVLQAQVVSLREGKSMLKIFKGCTIS